MAVVLSKVFPECRHTGSCTKHASIQMYKFFISNAKYYAPLLALKILAKVNKLSPAIVKKSFLYYLECTTGGWAIGWTIQTLICALRYILGEYKYSTFVYVPSLLGALHIFWFSPRVQHLFVVSVFQCSLETVLLRQRNILTRTLFNSTILQTLIFMSCSALILHAKQTGDFKGFWLLTPNKKEIKYEDSINSEVVNSLAKVCCHDEETCNLYIVKGVKKYLIFGLMLDVIKTLRSKATTNGFLPKLFEKLRNFKLHSTALLASYIGIYRFMHCYFNRKSNANLKRNHNLASFVSGICYLFLPNLTLLSYAIVSSIEVLYQILKPKGDEIKTEHIVWKYMRVLPITKIIFPFCLAHLIHNYSLYPNSVSNLTGIIINGTTNNHAGYILSCIQKYRNGLQSTI